MKQSRLLFGFGLFLICSLTFTSCSGNASREIIVDVEMQGVLKQHVRNPNNFEFVKVLKATRKIHSKKGGNFIAIFFEQSGRMFPNKRFVMYFRFNSEINVSSTNVEVISYFMREREKCLNVLIECFKVRLADSQITLAESIKGEDRIKIQSGGNLDKKEFAKLIETQGDLEFYETFTQVDLSSTWRNLNNLAIGETFTERTAMDLIHFDNHSCFVPTENKKEVDLFLNREDAVSLFPQNLKFMWGAKEIDSKSLGVKGYNLYAVKIPNDGRANVRGADIVKANVAYSSDAGNSDVESISGPTYHGESDGNPIVDIVLNQEGELKLRKLTRRFYREKIIAITIDGEVVSAPFVNETIWAGNAEISGGFTKEEAQELATLITIGILPVKYKIQEIKKL